jgi:DNA-binding LacI/PurR family transcriptional regulator
MAAQPTIKDIAARAGVSISTVHYALRGTRPIRPATRERILAAVRALDYQPHAGAATLPTGRTGRLAVVIAGIEPAFANTYFSDFVRGLAAAAEARDFTVVLYTAYGRRAAQGWRPLHVLRRREADGLVLMGTQVPPGHLADLVPEGGRCVLLNREHPGLPAITADRRQGTRLAAAHLLSLGCAPLGLIAADFPGGGPEDARPEPTGFHEALAAAGPAGELVEVAGGHLVRFAPASGPVAEPATALVRRLLEAGQAAGRRPGLVVFSYTLGQGVCRALARLGVRVPDDLALVVGDEDSAVGDALDVPLTTVQAPKFEMAVAAADLLLDAVQGRDIPPAARHQGFPMRLHVRWSCGARHRPRSPSVGA